jgi:hypothetical protein
MDFFVISCFKGPTGSAYIFSGHFRHEILYMQLLLNGSETKALYLKLLVEEIIVLKVFNFVSLNSRDIVDSLC